LEAHLELLNTTTMGDKRRSGGSGGSIGGGGGEKSPSVKKQSQSQSHDHFDIVQLNQHLNVCIREKDSEVDLDEYISVFQQLYKFFIMLGTVFGFVGSDVKAKLEILEAFRKGEGKASYETVEKMLEFEKRTDLIHTNKEASGSRTLLRLHRALNFVSKFLDKIDGLKDSEGTSHVAKEAYTDTLAKYHPWLIQKGAILAMYALPNKKDLISKVCDGKIEVSEARRLLHDVISSTEKIYNQCEAAYKGHDLLSLP